MDSQNCGHKPVVPLVVPLSAVIAPLVPRLAGYAKFTRTSTSPRRLPFS